MSINVTVSGNPVSIKRGKMIMSDVENFKKKETQRRRKVRLEQVRQQSKDIATEVRERVKRETENQLSKLEKKQGVELKKWQTKKLLNLQQQYNECLEAIGSGHTEAALQPISADVLNIRNKENLKNAEDRGKKATKILHDTCKTQHENKTALINQKKMTRNFENHRSSLVSSLNKATKSSKRKSNKRGSPAKEFQDETISSQVEIDIPPTPECSPSKFVKKMPDIPEESFELPSLDPILELSDDFKKPASTNQRPKKVYDPKMYQDFRFARPSTATNVYRPPAEPVPAPPFDPTQPPFTQKRLINTPRYYNPVQFELPIVNFRDRNRSPVRSSDDQMSTYRVDKTNPVEPGVSYRQTISPAEDKSPTLTTTQHEKLTSLQLDMESVEPIQHTYDSRLSDLIKRRIINQYSPEYPSGDTYEWKSVNKRATTSETILKYNDPTPSSSNRLDAATTSFIPWVPPTLDAIQEEPLKLTPPVRKDENLSIQPKVHKNSKIPCTTKAISAKSDIIKTIPSKRNLNPARSSKSNIQTQMKKVQYYDHDNRYKRQYTARSDLVQPVHSNDNDRVDLAVSELERQQYLERDIQRDLAAKKRGREAWQKEKIDRDYKLLLNDLSVLQKEERLATSHKSQVDAHLSKERLAEKIQKQQRKMETAFEDVYFRTHRTPLITLEPIQRANTERSDVPFETIELTESNIPSLNVATWNIPPTQSGEIVEKEQILQSLLDRINLQRTLLLNEVAALPPTSNLQELLKNVEQMDRDDKTEPKYSKKRRKDESVNTNSLTSKNLKQPSESKQTHKKETKTIPEMRSTGTSYSPTLDKSSPAHNLTEITTVVDIEIEATTDDSNKSIAKSAELKQTTSTTISTQSQSEEPVIKKTIELRDSSVQTSEITKEIQGQVGLSESQVQIFIKLHDKQKQTIRSNEIPAGQSTQTPKIVQLTKTQEKKKIISKQRPILERRTIRSMPDPTPTPGWTNFLRQSPNITNETTSTSYLTPPKKFLMDDLSKSVQSFVLSESTSQFSRASSNELDTVTKRLIQTLLTMSRTSIENLTVSSVSEATTPDIDVVHTRENITALDSDVESVLNEFFRVPTYSESLRKPQAPTTTKKDLSSQYEVEINKKIVQPVTSRKMLSAPVNKATIPISRTLEIRKSRAEILPEPTIHLEAVEITGLEPDDSATQRYLALAEFCTKKIDSLTSMINKVRAETQELYETVSPSEADQESTAYLSLPASDHRTSTHHSIKSNQNDIEMISPTTISHTKTTEQIVSTVPIENRPVSSFKDILRREPQVQSNAPDAEYVIQRDAHFEQRFPTQQTNLVGYREIPMQFPAPSSISSLDNNVRQTDANGNTFIPILAGIPNYLGVPPPYYKGTSESESSTVFEPHRGLTPLPQTISSDTTSSNVSTTDNKPKRRPKPPSTTVNILKHNIPLNTATMPYELSTIVEADSTRNFSSMLDQSKDQRRLQMQRTVEELMADKARKITDCRNTSPRTKNTPIDEFLKITQILPSTSSSPRSRSPSLKIQSCDNHLTCPAYKMHASTHIPNKQSSSESLPDIITELTQSPDKSIFLQLTSTQSPSFDQTKDASEHSKSSSSNSLDDALKQLGLGWAIATLRKTQQSLQLSPGSSSTDINLSRLGFILSDSSLKDFSLQEIFQQEQIKKISGSSTPASIEHLTAIIRDIIDNQTLTEQEIPPQAKGAFQKLRNRIKDIVQSQIPAPILNLPPEEYENVIDSQCNNIITLLTNPNVNFASLTPANQMLVLKDTMVNDFEANEIDSKGIDHLLTEIGEMIISAISSSLQNKFRQERTKNIPGRSTPISNENLIAEIREIIGSQSQTEQDIQQATELIKKFRNKLTAIVQSRIPANVLNLSTEEHEKVIKNLNHNITSLLTDPDVDFTSLTPAIQMSRIKETIANGLEARGIDPIEVDRKLTDISEKIVSEISASLQSLIQQERLKKITGISTPLSIESLISAIRDIIGNYTQSDEISPQAKNVLEKLRKRIKDIVQSKISANALNLPLEEYENFITNQSNNIVPFLTNPDVKFASLTPANQVLALKDTLANGFETNGFDATGMDHLLTDVSEMIVTAIPSTLQSILQQERMKSISGRSTPSSIEDILVVIRDIINRTTQAEEDVTRQSKNAIENFDTKIKSIIELDLLNFPIKQKKSIIKNLGDNITSLLTNPDVDFTSLAPIQQMSLIKETIANSLEENRIDSTEVDYLLADVSEKIVTEIPALFKSIPQQGQGSNPSSMEGLLGAFRDIISSHTQAEEKNKDAIKKIQNQINDIVQSQITADVLNLSPEEYENIVANISHNLTSLLSNGDIDFTSLSQDYQMSIIKDTLAYDLNAKGIDSTVLDHLLTNVSEMIVSTIPAQLQPVLQQKRMQRISRAEQIPQQANDAFQKLQNGLKDALQSQIPANVLNLPPEEYEKITKDQSNNIATLLINPDENFASLTPANQVLVLKDALTNDFEARGIQTTGMDLLLMDVSEMMVSEIPSILQSILRGEHIKNISSTSMSAEQEDLLQSHLAASQRRNIHDSIPLDKYQHMSKNAFRKLHKQIKDIIRSEIPAHVLNLSPEKYENMIAMQSENITSLLTNPDVKYMTRPPVHQMFFIKNTIMDCLDAEGIDSTKLDNLITAVSKKIVAAIPHSAEVISTLQIFQELPGFVHDILAEKLTTESLEKLPMKESYNDLINTISHLIATAFATDLLEPEGLRSSAEKETAIKDILSSKLTSITPSVTSFNDLVSDLSKMVTTRIPESISTHGNPKLEKPGKVHIALPIDPYLRNIVMEHIPRDLLNLSANNKLYSTIITSVSENIQPLYENNELKIEPLSHVALIIKMILGRYIVLHPRIPSDLTDSLLSDISINIARDLAETFPRFGGVILPAGTEYTYKIPPRRSQLWRKTNVEGTPQSSSSFARPELPYTHHITPGVLVQQFNELNSFRDKNIRPSTSNDSSHTSGSHNIGRSVEITEKTPTETLSDKSEQNVSSGYYAFVTSDKQKSASISTVTSTPISPKKQDKKHIAPNISDIQMRNSSSETMDLAVPDVNLDIDKTLSKIKNSKR